MPNEPKIQEPILVKNPRTGRFVDISPLFDAMAKVDGSSTDSVVNLKEVIAQTIRFINISCDRDANLVDLKNVVFDLYQLEDMFGAMAEFKQR